MFKSVVAYVEPPFWNLWYCGGNVLWQNSQSALLSPVYPLALVTSLPLAMKINILFHYWVGFIGMHLLLRRVFALRSWCATIYLASVFTLAGAVLALMVYNGSLHAMALALMGFGLFAVLASLLARRWRPLIVTTVMIAAGLGYAAPKFLPVTLFVTGDHVVDTRTNVDFTDWMPLDLLVQSLSIRFK